MKLAVVGGGSTYTPELVDGLARERERLPCASSCCTTSTPSGSSSSAGWPRACSPRQGFGGRLDVTDDLDRARRRRRRRAPPAPRRRPGRRGSRTRRVPLAVRLHRPGDDRRGRARQGAAHGPGRARHRRARRASSPPRRLDRRLHQPGRHRHARAARRGPPGGRPVQRGDRLPAPVRAAAAASTPERVLVDQVGLNHLTWVRAVRVDGDDVLPRAARRARRRARRARSGCRARCSTSSASSRPTTCATSTRTTRCSRSSSRARRARPTVAEIERELLELYRDPTLDEKPALLEQRGGAFYSEAATGLVASLAAGDGDVQVVDVRNGGDARRPAPTTTSWRCRRGSTRDGPVPLPQRPARARAARPRPARRGVRAPRPPRRRVDAATAVGARKALLAHPLVGQYAIAASCSSAARRRAASAGARRMTRRAIVLAVDGGNSKTDLALVRADGALLALVRGPLGSPHHLGLERLGRRCSTACSTRRVAAGRPRRRAAADGRGAPPGRRRLPGRGAPAARRGRGARLGRAHRPSRNDTFAVLRAGTERGWGVAVVCGAGINCVGVAPDGRHARFPALGAITGDWGGGYDVGLAALSAAARSEDGRGPTTSLERAVPAHFGLRHAARARRGDPRRRASPSGALIELAPVVLAEAADDAVAAAIVERLAAEVVALARVALDAPRPRPPAGRGAARRRAPACGRRAAARARSTRGLREVGAGDRRPPTSSPPIVGAAFSGSTHSAPTTEARERIREELGRPRTRISE